MEIIDCFCGLGPWQKRDRLLPYKTEDILALMDHFGITRALVHGNYAPAHGSALHGNRLLIEASRGNDRFIPALTIEPHPYDDSPSPGDYFDTMRSAGAKAVFIDPPSSAALTWLYDDILAGCVERKLPLFLDRSAALPEHINLMCSAFPDLRTVLTGVGYGEDYVLYPLLRRHANLHLCLGHFYIPSYSPMRFLQHFPAERMLFGSGLPFFSPGGMVAMLMYADISDEDRHKILAGNITRLLGEADV